MKKNTLYLFILLLITGLNTSCNYLDIVPDETATEKDAFANPRAALRYLYSCYGYLPQSNKVETCMDFTGDETISPFSESYVKFAEGPMTQATRLSAIGIHFSREYVNAIC